MVVQHGFYARSLRDHLRSLATCVLLVQYLVCDVFRFVEKRRRKNLPLGRPQADSEMSRTDKLYRRLESLESELRRFLRDEFTVESVGKWSAFLNGPTVRRTIPDVVDIAHLDSLQRIIHQVESLRGKLGERIPGPVLGVLLHFRRAWDQLGVRQTDSDWNALVKQALSELDSLP